MPSILGWVKAFGGDGYTAHVRDFAPLYGIPEESATGTANAALTYYLQQNGCLGARTACSFLQGEAMGRPSVIASRISTDGQITQTALTDKKQRYRLSLWASGNMNL